MSKVRFPLISIVATILLSFMFFSCPSLSEEKADISLSVHYSDITGAGKSIEAGSSRLILSYATYFTIDLVGKNRSYHDDKDKGSGNTVSFEFKEIEVDYYTITVNAYANRSSTTTPLFTSIKGTVLRGGRNPLVMYLLPASVPAYSPSYFSNLPPIAIGSSASFVYNLGNPANTIFPNNLPTNALLYFQSSSGEPLSATTTNNSLYRVPGGQTRDGKIYVTIYNKPDNTGPYATLTSGVTELSPGDLSLNITATGNDYYKTVSIALASGTSSSIFYTLNGTAPSANSTPYSGSFAAGGYGVSMTIRAIAVVNGINIGEATPLTLHNGNALTTPTAVSSLATSLGASTNSQSKMTSTDENTIYFTFGHSIQKVDLRTGATTLIAGNVSASGSTDGTGSAARFYSPCGICTDGAYLYVADSGNNKIRKIEIVTGATSFVSGSGTAGDSGGSSATAQFNAPGPMTICQGFLYVGDTSSTYNTYSVKRVDPGTGYANIALTLTSLIPRGITNDGTYAYIIISSTSGSNVLLGRYLLPSLSSPTPSVITSSTTSFGICTDGSYLYFADYQTHLIIKINSSLLPTTLAGNGTNASADGTLLSASFYLPSDICIAGGKLYVMQHNSNTVFRVIQ